MSYVPKEIIDSMNEGRNWQDTECINEYEKDGMYFKEMKCGCVYGNGMKTFSFSNHFCSEHAPRHEFGYVTKQEESNE